MTAVGYLGPGTWVASSHAVLISYLRHWISSGCAVETLLLAIGPPHHWTIPKLTLLTVLNIAWSLAATSWLFHILFACFCWPLVIATSIVQYASVSSFTRRRLRSLWRQAHFTRDRVAFFEIPSLKLDSGISGLVTVRGITTSLSSLTVELHGVEISMDLGSGHELCILSDGLKMSIFRTIAIDEICGVHWFNGDLDQSGLEEQRRDSHIDDRDPPPDKERPSSGDPLRSVVSNTNSSKREAIKDKLSRVVSNDLEDGAPVPTAPAATTKGRPPPDENSRNRKVQTALARSDLEADERYDHALEELNRTNRLFQSRQRIREARKESSSEISEKTELQHTVCADLRTIKMPQSGASGEIGMTHLMEILEPVSRFMDRVPIVLRLILWMLTQSHKISCPSICFTAAGPFLGGALLDRLFRDHATEDKRIKQLKREASSWLSSANLYFELADVKASSSVPLVTSNDISCDLRSKRITVTRIGADVASSGYVAQLAGADGSFTIPTCLLPSHAYLAPSPKPREELDTAPVTMAVRATMPAHFSEASLRFAATLCKTSQMLDIEEEAGLATEAQSTNTDPRNPLTKGNSYTCDAEEGHEKEECAVHTEAGFRDQLGHGRLRAALKHPIQHTKQTLHKEVKRTAVDNVDGAWFVKWVTKFLRQLEQLDGDVGYTHDIPVTITRPGAAKG